MNRNESFRRPQFCAAIEWLMSRTFDIKTGRRSKGQMQVLAGVYDLRRSERRHGADPLLLCQGR